MVDHTVLNCELVWLEGYSVKRRNVVMCREDYSNNVNIRASLTLCDKFHNSGEPANSLQIIELWRE